MTTKIQPSLDDLRVIIDECRATNAATAGSCASPVIVAPVFSNLSLELTPHQAYLKLTANQNSPSFLFESAVSNAVSRYSFFGVNPRKTLLSGPTVGVTEDPLIALEAELAGFRQAEVPGLPPMSGGAIGYVSYDCVHYFEPKTKRDLKDVLELPEAALMLFDTIVAYDNVYSRFQVIHNIRDDKPLPEAYAEAEKTIAGVIGVLSSSEPVPYPEQPPIKEHTFESNIGQEGYENHVKRLKEHIMRGDIIQAVPSQRVARPTSLHPFNIYRHLRTVNPSPYMFYIDFQDFQIVGASPELLVKSDAHSRIVTHPIAGTVKRGKTLEEDDELAAELRASLKDRAEHVMLVDLARNDVNRVCDPRTTTVDKLMNVERFSHVMHLVSQVSGTLREDKNRFDALRSIFPAGTVSGAPKVKAMELIGELEGEKRGVYAGAVGHWSYDGKSMDTCIALRTMVYKNGVAYLQAGGGIVYDSDPYDEYIETMNKMMANHNTIVQAENIWADKVGRA